MTYLFEEASLKILESLSFNKTLYAFDFDGTLSKIVRVPSAATIAKTTNVLLQQLSQLVPVAIVSGRSIEDLRRRLGFSPHYLIGNHGLEGLEDHRFSLKEAQETCLSWKGVLANTTFGTGVEIEDKTYSLTLNFRCSHHKKEIKEQIARAVSSLAPLPRVIRGKSVINLLPAAAPHKGIAILELMFKEGAPFAFYIGDDDTDEDVYSLPNSQIISIRVGEKRTSNARYFIERQSQINDVLKLLIRNRRVAAENPLNTSREIKVAF